jgi:hypothetical protein
MKQQTPLRKAISEIEEVIEDFTRLLESNPSHTMKVNSIACIAALQTVIEETITPLLPTEQQVIETSYEDGRADGQNWTLHYHYFTSNFEQ